MRNDTPCARAYTHSYILLALFPGMHIRKNHFIYNELMLIKCLVWSVPRARIGEIFLCRLGVVCTLGKIGLNQSS